MVEALAAAGLLQMFLPRAIGGRELPPLVAFRAIEEVSEADGSVGWCTMIATVLSLFTGWLDPGPRLTELRNNVGIVLHSCRQVVLGKLRQ